MGNSEHKYIDIQRVLIDEKFNKTIRVYDELLEDAEKILNDEERKRQILDINTEKALVTSRTPKSIFCKICALKYEVYLKHVLDPKYRCARGEEHMFIPCN